ncbi:MAG: hypothetical protein K8R11_03080 [Methanococcoides sp.]|nr:hypothetical protein [Methanococcoides sp.]
MMTKLFYSVNGLSISEYIIQCVDIFCDLVWISVDDYQDCIKVILGRTDSCNVWLPVEWIYL